MKLCAYNKTLEYRPSDQESNPGPKQEYLPHDRNIHFQVNTYSSGERGLRQKSH
jgi:hypothetical protein